MIRTKKKYKFPIAFLMNMISLGLFGQSPVIDSAKDAFEQIYLVTDRVVYAVDETVHFKIINQDSFHGSNVSWSNIVYCEIITPDGNPIVKVKSLVSNNCGSGELIIPRNTLSGNYYIRAYTKWMKNQSPYSFAYQSIKIINPFTTEVLKNTISPEAGIKFKPVEIAQPELISLVNKDSTFKTNETVEFQLKANCNNCFRNDISVAVVRKGLSAGNHLLINDIYSQISEVKFIPETRGVSLSGKVINKTDSLPVPFADVWITLLAEKPVTREALTDQDGNFYFDFGNGVGHYELNISATTNTNNVEPIIRVDNDFSFSKVNLPFIPFEIEEQDQELYETIAISSQLQKIFYERESKSDSLKFSFENLFYGKPDFTIKFKKFIDLPTIEDYIKDLIPNVILRKDGSKRNLKIYSNLSHMAVYEPLVMVNLIKYSDVDAILKLPPRLIDRVELITVPFLRGEMIYGGIIHFITKSSDFSEFDFTSGSILIDFDMIGINDPFIMNQDKSDLPKVGNCLYWNPSLKISDRNDTLVRFNTGSEPGEFELVIEGLDQNARPFQMRKNITIQ